MRQPGIRWAALGLGLILATGGWAWRPAGWVYHDYPWACEGSTGDWYWFNTSDTQWVARMDNGQWSQLKNSALATGWGYYEGSYAVAQGNGAWHWIKEDDEQWVANMRTGAWSLFGRASEPGGEGEGIFADFRTSMGDFTARLDYERAPGAAANFAGLATGEKTWMDAQGNLRNQPFYDGTIFHRVVKDGAGGHGIAIQGGGVPTYAANTNTGAVATNFANAGYYALEGVDNGLLHSNGAISMANSGPNTDGSQFFVVASNVPSWNGSYTVFGNVVSGMSAVAAIAAVAVQGTGSRPVEDVRLHTVRIRRVGAAAEAFDAGAQGLPVAESGPMWSHASGTNQILEFDIAPQTKMTFRESGDLAQWEKTDWGYHTGPAHRWTTSVSRAELGERYFVHLARIRHPVAITSPEGNRGKKFTFWWNENGLKYEANFYTNLLGGYAWTTLGTNAPVLREIAPIESWSREAYSAQLYFIDTTGVGTEYRYSLGFDPGKATNRFTGGYRSYGGTAWVPITGTFTAGD